VGTTSPPIVTGAQLFHDKGCEFCHMIEGQGGMRGPDLTDVAHRLSENDLRIKIANGGSNMPSFAGILTHDDLDNLVAFLESRVTIPPAQTSSAAEGAALAQSTRARAADARKP
jgi:ubiquinol-cytochrome c reductase cytochrome b subunit